MFVNIRLKFLLITFAIWVHGTAGQDNTIPSMNNSSNITIHGNQTEGTSPLIVATSNRIPTQILNTIKSEENVTQSTAASELLTSRAYSTPLRQQNLNMTTTNSTGVREEVTLKFSHRTSERTSTISTLIPNNIVDLTTTINPISTTKHSTESATTADFPSTSAPLTTKVDVSPTSITGTKAPETTSAIFTVTRAVPSMSKLASEHNITVSGDTTSAHDITSTNAQSTSTTTAPQMASTATATSSTKSLFSSSLSLMTTTDLPSTTSVHQTTRPQLTISLTQSPPTLTSTVVKQKMTTTSTRTTASTTRQRATTTVADTSSESTSTLVTHTTKTSPKTTNKLVTAYLPVSANTKSFPTSANPTRVPTVSTAGVRSSNGSTTSPGSLVTSTCGTTCSIKCDYGRKVDEKGCPLCECVDSSDMPADIERILQEFWWIFLMAVIVLIIVIIIVAVWCWYKRRNIEQQERERVARHCPTDTMLKANSAFHLALQQQRTAYNDDDTLEVQRRYRADIGGNVLAGPEDRETVFDVNEFHNEQQMKSFFQMSQGKQEHSPASVRSTNKQTQTSAACGEGRMLPDVVGSSALHDFHDDEIEPDLHFKTSQDSFDGIDYHRSMPGTPTKLTEL